MDEKGEEQEEAVNTQQSQLLLEAIFLEEIDVPRL